MSFFEPPSAPAEPGLAPMRSRAPDWIGPPEDVQAGIVPLELFVYRSRGAVVVLTSAEVYEQGCHFQLRFAIRRTGEPEDQWGQKYEAVAGDYPRRVSSSQLPDERPRFGIEYRDGTKATTIDAQSRRVGVEEDAEPPEPPVLRGSYGAAGGGDDTFDMEYVLWLWPLPPAELFDFVAEWPALGMSLTRVPLDGVAINEAAGRACPLWPDSRD